MHQVHNYERSYAHHRSNLQQSQSYLTLIAVFTFITLMIAVAPHLNHLHVDHQAHRHPPLLGGGSLHHLPHGRQAQHGASHRQVGLQSEAKVNW